MGQGGPRLTWRPDVLLRHGAHAGQADGGALGGALRQQQLPLPHNRCLRSRLQGQPPGRASGMMLPALMTVFCMRGPGSEVSSATGGPLRLRVWSAVVDVMHRVDSE